MPLSDDQMNTILSNINENIPSDCSTYNDIRRKSEQETPILGKDAFNISDYEAYRNDIEFVNSFTDQVLIDEAQYFKNKYSAKVYEYLLDRRREYTSQEKIQSTTALCGDAKSQCATVDPVLTEEEKAEKEKCKESQDFLSFLLNQTQSKKPRPETIYKKIEYRNESHEFLITMNSFLSLLYFAILAFVILLLAATNRLLLSERFLLYLFLFLLPFLFPYFFEGAKYIYQSTIQSTPDHGPKDAFLETN